MNFLREQQLFGQIGIPFFLNLNEEDILTETHTPEFCVVESANLWSDNANCLVLLSTWFKLYGNILLDDKEMIKELNRKSLRPDSLVLLGTLIKKHNLKLPDSYNHIKSVVKEKNILFHKSMQFHCKNKLLPCDAVAEAEFGVIITEISSDYDRKLLSLKQICKINPEIKKREAMLIKPQ